MHSQSSYHQQEMDFQLSRYGGSHQESGKRAIFSLFDFELQDIPKQMHSYTAVIDTLYVIRLEQWEFVYAHILSRSKNNINIK